MTPPNKDGKKTADRGPAGRFTKGNRASPGRPAGRGKVAELRDKLAQDLDQIIAVLRAQALAGDPQAIRILLDRVLPSLRPVELPTPLNMPDGTLAQQAHAVVQAAETAVREVVGKMRMDTALAEERDQIAPRVRTLMQTILDRYKVGVEVVGINLQQGGVRPPEQVQASFDDVLKAGQERERAKNEAEAYANDVIPRAVGSASRLKEEAAAYKARIVAQAQGDAQRFTSVLAEYQKAPQVTRDRMYLESMQQIYDNVTKVLVESRQGSNLLYLPLDKIMQGVAQSSGAVEVPASGGAVAVPSSAAAGSLSNDSRARDSSRTRDRETR